MNKNLIVMMVLIIFLALGLAHTAYYYPQLPDRVAIHFNAQGEADGFASKTANAVLMVSIQLGLGVMFILLGLMMNKLPVSLINMPHKEYWLAPERKTESVGKIQCSLWIIAIGTQIFMLSINHMTTRHNLGLSGMGWFWPVFVAYMTFIFGYCIWLSIAFRRPPESELASS